MRRYSVNYHKESNKRELAVSSLLDITDVVKGQLRFNGHLYKLDPEACIAYAWFTQSSGITPAALTRLLCSHFSKLQQRLQCSYMQPSCSHLWNACKQLMQRCMSAESFLREFTFRQSSSFQKRIWKVRDYKRDQNVHFSIASTSWELHVACMLLSNSCLLTEACTFSALTDNLLWQPEGDNKPDVTAVRDLTTEKKRKIK